MAYNVANRCDFHDNQMIDGKYIINKQLGEGAFGKVFKVTACQGNNNQTFALKLLKLWEVPENIRQGLIDRFDMEFATGQIQSDYLVHSLDHGFVEGNPYIIMEFCSGGDLSQFIVNERSSISSQQLTLFCQHILKGLHDLHISGKVHRDLKPENVLLKAKDWAVLTDFGISGDRNKRMTERNILGKPTQIFGTYAYMPPEQVQRMKGDATVLPTTDIFSFGVLLYQLIVGELPFGPLCDHNQLVLYQANANKGCWDVNKLRRASPDSYWENIIAGCLLPDYRNRIQRTADILKMIPNFKTISSPLTFQSAGSNMLLRIMQGEEYGKVFYLNELLKQYGSVLPMGRDGQNAIYIQEFQSSYVSRRHCTIEYDDRANKWYIRDGQWIKSQKGNNSTQPAYGGNWSNSTNGTYLNSLEVTSQGMCIQNGDIISVGDVKLRVENYE